MNKNENIFKTGLNVYCSIIFVASIVNSSGLFVNGDCFTNNKINNYYVIICLNNVFLIQSEYNIYHIYMNLNNDECVNTKLILNVFCFINNK